jgi:hypothetical protein
LKNLLIKRGDAARLAMASRKGDRTEYYTIPFPPKKGIILPLNASTDPQPTDRRLAHMGPAAETFSFLKVVSCLLYLEDFYSGVIYLNLMIENDLHYCFEYGSIFKSSIGV